MRRLMLLLLATTILLCAVACNNDPNLYKYDSSSYLGSWEIDIAPIEGDVDGCIQLVQYTFNSDFTYEVVQYKFDAQTKQITIVEGADGVYEYVYDDNTGIGTLTLDYTGLAPTEYFWSMSSGKLFTFQYGTVGKQYVFKRPQYIVKKAADQRDIVGIWDHTVYQKNTVGEDIRQLEFKSDGTLEEYLCLGVGGPVQHSVTTSWKYKVADEERSYSRTYHSKWEYGSEIIVSATPSSVGADLHEKSNRITRYDYAVYVDNGVMELVDELPIIQGMQYVIYQYGDKQLLVMGGDTYVKVSNHIDMSSKTKEIVYPWHHNPTDTHLYLRSDGTYSSDFVDLLNYSQDNDDNFYSGTYSTSYNEVATADYVAFMEQKFKDEYPGVVPPGGWAAWLEEQAAFIETMKEDNYVQLYNGTITFRPDFGFEETFKFFMRIKTPKYGIEDHLGDPETQHDMIIRTNDNEGDVNYYELI
ncbi:MAG: hypothetical protein IJR16_06510 [Spirochaetales bacterium]|nr:hypothetical protein [Spirochaetales bacterium]